ncbi:MAG: hypothetical protein ACREDU_11695, partial [Methylocella sp.]
MVAPSLVPTRPGDHVKTGRRDATAMAFLFRSGEPTPVWGPGGAHEAMRDLCRARQAAMEGLRRARQQVLSFLLRHGRIYSGGGHWTRKHRLWLAAQRFGHPARQIAFEERAQAVEETQARRDRLAKQMQELAPSWPLAKAVTARQARPRAHRRHHPPGRDWRLSSLRQSSPAHRLSRSDAGRTIFFSKNIARRNYQGRKHKRKTGAGRASTYRLPARIGAEILKRNESLPRPVKDIAFKAIGAAVRPPSQVRRRENQPTSSTPPELSEL